MTEISKIETELTFINDLSVSPNSIRGMKTTWSQFLEYAESTNLEIGADSILSFLQNLNLAPASINLKAQQLKKILKNHPTFKSDLSSLRAIDQFFREKVGFVKLDKKIGENDRFFGKTA